MRTLPTRTHRRVVTTLAAACALALTLAACSPDVSVPIDVPPQAEGDFPADTAQQLQDAVTHAMAAAGASGAVVGVWAPWSGSWVAGVGTQVPGGTEAVSADQVFRAAQITRPMVCDVLYAVAGEGTVALDAKVSDYISGASEISEVTLEQLCDGTSGIGSYAGQLRPLWMSNPTRAWDPRELASYGLGQERTTDPGAAYRDSDAGYVILGLALERITRMSAAELIAQYVADPLDLTATTLPGRRATAPDGILTGTLSLPGEDGALNCAAPTDMTSMSPSIGFTDAGVVSDVQDLRRYVQALATKALLPDGIDRFADAKPVFDGAPSWYTTAGGAVQAGSLIGQSGSTPGYSTAAFADPTTGMTVVVVLNNSASGNGIVTALAWELAAIASKAPAAAGATAPEAGLPWTAEQFHEQITAGAVCPIP